MSRRIRNRQGGFIVSAELMLIATILVIGMIVGLKTLRDAVITELADVGQAISQMDQGYTYSGVDGHAAGTAGSLIAPMLTTLSLSPEAAMLAAASGSVIIKYVNSSYFWVCTSLSTLSVSDAILSYGGATLVGGVVSFAVVCLLWSFGFI